MKRILVITLVAFLTASTLYAKPAGMKACTADGKNVGLVVEIADDASIAVSKSIAQAFTNAAAALPVERLVTAEGFRLFVSGLSDEAKQATEVPGPPRILDGSCKVSKS